MTFTTFLFHHGRRSSQSSTCVCYSWSCQARKNRNERAVWEILSIITIWTDLNSAFIQCPIFTRECQICEIKWKTEDSVWSLQVSFQKICSCKYEKFPLLNSIFLFCQASLHIFTNSVQQLKYDRLIYRRTNICLSGIRYSISYVRPYCASIKW